MSMRNSFALLALAGSLLAQQQQLESLNSVRVNLAADSPVSLLGNEWSASESPWT